MESVPVGARALAEPATVLVVDDHPVVRHGLAALLSAEEWVGRVVEASDTADGAQLAVVERPALAVVDLGLPDASGTELITRIRHTAPDCVIVVLTMTGDDSAVTACLEAGARAYLRKDIPPPALLVALRAAFEGAVVLGPNLAVGALVRKADTALPAPLNRLTPGDLRVVTLLAEGRGNAEIARQIDVSEKTVRNRLSTIYSLLGVADRVQAALLAREKGVLDRTTN